MSIKFLNEEEKRYWHMAALTILRSDNILHHADATHYADDIIKAMRERTGQNQPPISNEFVAPGCEKFTDKAEAFEDVATELYRMVCNAKVENQSQEWKEKSKKACRQFQELIAKYAPL